MSKRRLGAAVDAADAAGGEDLDAGEAGADHRGGDGGGAGPALAEGDGEVGARELADVGGGGEALEPVGLEADMDAALHHRDGGGDGAGGGDLGLDGARGREVLGMRHAVGDDRRFEGDERPAGGDGLGDGGREGERWGHGTSQVMWRAAAARAARSAASGSRPSARAARWAATKASPAPVRPTVATGGGGRVTLAWGRAAVAGAAPSVTIASAAPWSRRAARGRAAVGQGGAADPLRLAAVQVERQGRAPMRWRSAAALAGLATTSAAGRTRSSSRTGSGRLPSATIGPATPAVAERGEEGVPAASRRAQSATAAWISPLGPSIAR